MDVDTYSPSFPTFPIGAKEGAGSQGLKFHSRKCYCPARFLICLRLPGGIDQCSPGCGLFCV